MRVRQARFRPQWFVVFMAVVSLNLGIAYTQKSTALTQRSLGAPRPQSYKLPSFFPVQPLSQMEAIDCNAVPCVALTFDDGPDPVNTPAVLDVLAKQHIHATFFMIGYRVAAYPAIARRAYLEGHEVENHSWSHTDFTRLKPAEIVQQIDLTQAAIIHAGLPAPTMFRPPYGALNDTVRANVHLPVITWNVDPKDWKESDPAKVAAAAADPAAPGSIILMHSVHPVDAPSLTGVIEKIRAKGYQIVTVSELLNLPPGASGVYAHK